ncbi:hypothetical protein Rhopal_004152-T1 [Rhodotorula paludigena]|uniref:General stress protein FMN-binding split barrel domain-containing protein n=1 Tax=Rhodotorula paludigena TaxID=86838 RepID=A0AAV5GKX6_9BASI|nr:hypothetical protein Rhopal_004152-T1 [Rhodotorula paludigena]
MASADPYTAKAEKNDVSPSQKIEELRGIIKECKFGLLVSRNADGHLHSRAMAPASHKGLVFQFIANEESGKFDELQNDEHVNFSFQDPSSTDWASIAGKASVKKDEATIKALYNPAIKARRPADPVQELPIGAHGGKLTIVLGQWFGDLKDGVHTGEPGDPRIAVIEVVPDEWIKTRTTLGQAAEVLKGAITGEAAAPGALRVISGSDLSLARQVEAQPV